MELRRFRESIDGGIEGQRNRGVFPSVVVGFDWWWVWIIPLSRRTQERRRTMGGGVSVVEDPCGGSVVGFVVSIGFVSLLVAENTKKQRNEVREERKKEKKKNKL